MAAVAHPLTHDRRVTPGDLTVLRPVAQRRPRRCSPSVLRRRRLVAVTAVMVLLLAGRWATVVPGGGPLAVPGRTAPPPGAGPGGGAGSPEASGPRQEHVVRPGDTVWRIARSMQPEGDVRPLVDRLMAERDGRHLVVGERVRAP